MAEKIGDKIKREQLEKKGVAEIVLTVRLDEVELADRLIGWHIERGRIDIQSREDVFRDALRFRYLTALKTVQSAQSTNR